MATSENEHLDDLPAEEIKQYPSFNEMFGTMSGREVSAYFDACIRAEKQGVPPPPLPTPRARFGAIVRKIEPVPNPLPGLYQPLIADNWASMLTFLRVADQGAFSLRKDSLRIIDGEQARPLDEKEHRKLEDAFSKAAKNAPATSLVPTTLLHDLVAIAEGRMKHTFTDSCPTLVEGSFDLSVECSACRVLLRYAALNRG